MGQLKDKFNARKDYDVYGPSWLGFSKDGGERPKFSYSDPDLPSLYAEYFIDSWNVIPLYGKVDTLGIPIMPKMGLVTFCSYTKDPNRVFLVQPAINFYNSFREQYEDYYALGAINKNSKFFKKTIPPVKGHIDGDVEYYNKVKQLYNQFFNYEVVSQNSKLSKLWSTNASNKIKNFDDFINELENYISFNNLYFTRAGYVESTDYSLLHSGLAVEIYNGDSSNDPLREEFVNDVNFPSFIELCARNNLKLDREKPWRVYVDVRTTPNRNNFNNKFNISNFQSSITQYLPHYKNIQDFFDFYYARAIPYDEVSFVYFQEFINLINSFYKSFIESFPTFKFYSINECGKATVKEIQRGLMPTLSVDKYLELYLRMRNIELKYSVNKEKLQELTKQSIELYKSLEKEQGLQNSVIFAVKYYTDNIGTLAYRNPSLYELDEKEKMP